MKMTGRNLLAIVAAATMLSAGGGYAQTMNHLKCYKVKEPGVTGKARAAYTMNLTGTGIPAESGCVIKTPAQLVCEPVVKTVTSTTPTPPGGGPTAATTKFTCYKLKCPKGPFFSGTAKDQFGTHNFQVGSQKRNVSLPSMLCAPASPSGAFLDTSADAF